MTKRLGIIGYPISHSLSPVIHQSAFSHYEWDDVVYEAWKICPSDLGKFVSECRSPDAGILGFNVTVPHKERVIKLLDDLGPEARLSGAVNTVVNDNGKLIGHNTDGLGFIRSLTVTGFEPKSKKIVILGAGGAARGIAFSLASQGVSSITIINRSMERAAKLIVDLNQEFPNLSYVCSLMSDDMGRALREADLIVQATSMGMVNGPSQLGSPLSSVNISSPTLAYELVYNPSETPFMKEAKKAGIGVISGLNMLVFQGAIAFELWFRKTAPVDIMMLSAKKALAIGY
jgi:shikimate dehydrogenase